MKFEDFGSILKRMQDSAATAVEGEKMKASVKWLNYSQKKWVLYCPKVNTKQTFCNVKFLLLPENEENLQVYRQACENDEKWTHKTLGALTAKYTCLEARATPANSPFVLIDEDEPVDILAFGLYSGSKTKRKHYTVQVSEMLLLSEEQVYNMKSICLEGDFMCESNNGKAKRSTAQKI